VVGAGIIPASGKRPRFRRTRGRHSFFRKFRGGGSVLFALVPVRLGGFVIHGNAPTLAASLESLAAVCDEVVAVDSGSTDGSAGVVARSGARAVSHPWQGYGAARAAAVRALEGCDWLLYLDSDERLEEPARAALRAWKASAPSTGVSTHLLAVRDWAELPGRRFLYRTHHRARLVRRDAALWKPSMIVHEGLSQRGAVRLPIHVEHRFAVDIPARGRKEETYALLWAVRAQAEGRRAKLPWLQRPALFFRDAFLKGAAFRGGAPALRLAWAVAAYHSRKYERLRELHRGQHAELTRAFAQGQYARVFELVQQSVHALPP
jgi:glycosyltransferase involved in cell wall biosynthesis